jgi:di/tripeptidase
MYALKVPAAPKTTFSASVVGGGTSVNAIPDEVWLEVDMRSESAAELAKLEQQFLDIVTRSVDAENAARSTAPGKITAERKKIGDRPAGQTAQSADIVRFATQAFAGEGIKLRYTASSTDSNVPMSLGIPSITVSGNALGGRAHALDEWMATDREPNLKLKRAVLATILATAGTR